MTLRWLACLLLPIPFAAQAQVTTPNPVMFVTQFPIPVDFGTIGSVFNNHRADMELVGRGGDLYIRYGDGSLRNLTREAGFGSAGVFQGAGAIAVRDPHVHWSGLKAVFSMVVGAPTAQHQQLDLYWQLYEVSGFGLGQTVQINRIDTQPANYNNVMPVYASDDQIIFVSDRPRNGARHLYPQQDEYESAPTNTGIWKLDPSDGHLQLLDHSPSGSFDPFVDSFGRVLFTRWDHLLRDQQNDAGTYGTFNYSSEALNSVPTSSNSEVFPEPRIASPGLNRFVINHFFPWEIRQDGTREETLNHLGRQELHRYFTRSFTNDPNLSDFEYTISGRTNPRESENYLQLHEDRSTPGRYYAVSAPEFGTHNSGQIIRLDAAPGVNPDDVVIDYVTHIDTRFADPSANNSGHYRNPIVLSSGAIIAAHADYQGVAGNDGTVTSPNPRYRFALRQLQNAANGFMSAGPSLTNGLSRHVQYFSPGLLIDYDGPFWELSPVEVVVQPVPPIAPATTAPPEAAAYALAGVSEAQFKAYLRANNLAVLVMRDVTTRDDAEEQQPFNLRVPGGRQTPANPVGQVYDIAHLQFLQGDQIRGRANYPGRRVLAQFMHDETALAANGATANSPSGSVPIAMDGSVAAFVPAQRALSWQSTSDDGTPVVRERYWLTAQPGEVRACDGCHGVNRLSHAGAVASSQTAQAFVDLLTRWQGDLFANGFE